MVNFWLITGEAARARLSDRAGELPSFDIGCEGPFMNVAQFWTSRLKRVRCNIGI